MSSPLPPPGWFPDPGNAAFLRYWDGTAWTAHTHPVGPAPELSLPLHQQVSAPVVDKYGDEILFQERTHGDAKSDVTVTKHRFTVGKRSIAFQDVDQLLHDSTQILSFGIKSGLSFTVLLNGVGIKPVGMITQNLPLRSGREQADRQYAEVCALLEAYLVPLLIHKLHGRILAGEELEIGGVYLSLAGIRRRKTSIRWSECCGTIDDGREVKVLGPTPDVVCANTFVGFANVRLLTRLCDLCAGLT